MIENNEDYDSIIKKLVKYYISQHYISQQRVARKVFIIQFTKALEEDTLRKRNMDNLILRNKNGEYLTW